MTSLIEKLIAIIAPHRCIICSEENNELCENCRLQLAGMSVSRCFLCAAETNNAATCYFCQKTTAIEYVWTTGNYSHERMQLIKQFKFEGVRAAALPLAKLLADTLPCLPASTVIVPVPTAWPRIRERGYDHARLLAKELATLTGCELYPLLGRRTQSRQVGARRSIRASQAETAFCVTNPAQCRQADVLLVDDVVTSGATLKAAGNLLHAAGARSVNAAVVASQPLR